jgi:hypothetical protein
LAQSKEAAEVTLFEGQGLMQALVDAGYDFRLYTELRKVSPDGNAVECGSPSGFEIRTMRPQILWLPAGAKVSQTRLKQCLAVENELFGNKHIVHQPTPKPRAVRIPVPKPAPAPPVATPKKQPAPKREISEAQPVAPANKQPAPKPVAAAPKVQTKVLDQKSLRELEREMGIEQGKSSRLVPPATESKKPKPQVIVRQQTPKPQLQVKDSKRPHMLMRQYNPRIAAQRRDIEEVAQRAAKRQADAARIGEIRWVNENQASKAPRDLPFPWVVFAKFLGCGLLWPLDLFVIGVANFY